MSMTTIQSKVRYLLGDTSTSTTDTFTYGTSAIFTLSEENVISVSTVEQNDTELGSGTWSYDSAINKVTVTASLTAGDTIEITYTYYPNYSNTELDGRIQGALVYLSINNYYDFKYDSTDDAIYPEMETREENLVAIVTATMIEPDNKSYALPDIRVYVPDDLPLHRKIAKLIAVFKKDCHGIFTIT